MFSRFQYNSNKQTDLPTFNQMEFRLNVFLM